MAWDPDTYLAFDSERARPARELLARVPVAHPVRVADLGCGPGNSTALLRARWPDAQIDAFDNSSEMLATARESGVDAEFVQADLAQWTPHRSYDVIYSNATLHWLRRHEVLFPRLMSYLRPGGVLAVQMPRNYDEPCHTLIGAVAADPRWSHRLPRTEDCWFAHSPERYFDILSLRADTCDIWETRYYQPLQGEDAVFHWISGTGLRPFAAALEGAMRDAFLAEYRRRVSAAYPRRADGLTIYPILRLFLVARAQSE